MLQAKAVAKSKKALGQGLLVERVSRCVSDCTPSDSSVCPAYFLLPLPPLICTPTHRFVPLRYIQWMHTTPTMILLMAMMSSSTSVGVWGAVLADLVMVGAGMIATWTSGVTQVGGV